MKRVNKQALASITKATGLDPVLSPETPAKPVTPAKPETPATPVKPVTPVTPAKQKMTVSIDATIVGRSRAAVQSLPFEAGVPTVTALVEVALDQYLTALESEYNQGESFSSLPPGVIKTGRPLVD